MTPAITLLITLSSPSSALDLFILDDGGSDTTNMVTELESWGHTVTLSSTDYSFYEYDFTGTETGLDVTTYDAVIWLDGAGAIASEMNSSGMTVLSDMVNAGGGLLLFGSTGYQYDDSEYYSGYGALIPLRKDKYTSSKAWSVVSASHPLAEGYVSGTSFSPDSGLLRDSSASSGTTVFTFRRSSTDYPAGVAVDLGSGRLVQYALWGNASSGFASFQTNWSDGYISQLVENAIQWIVLRPPDVVLSSSYSVAAESSVTLRPDSAVDPDGGTVTYSWDIGSDGTIDGTDISYSFSAAGYDGPTTEVATLTVTDDESATTVLDTTIDITNVDPVITGTSSSGTVSEGTSATLTVTYGDVESADTHTVTWDFGDGESGTGDSVSHAWGDNDRYTVNVTVTDDDGGSDSSVLIQTTTNVDPTLSGDPDTVAYQEVAYGFTPTVTDPGSADTFSFTGTVADGATLDSSTGEIAWTPTTDQLGDYRFALNVSDDDGGRDSMTWTVTVNIVDEDGDGMSDSWEVSYGLDPTDASDAAGDLDGDGRTNLEEYENGWDPTVYDGPGQPNLVWPTDGADVTEVPPSLLVDNVTAPLGQAMTYGFQVYEDEDLTSLVVSREGRVEGSDGTTEWVVSGTRFAENTDYWWTANAADAYVTAESTSPAFRFFVNAIDEAPTAPGIYSPFEGGIVNTLTPDMVLTASTDPDRDAITYSAFIEDSTGAVVAQVEGLTDDGSTATWTLTEDLVDETDYCWHAVAIDTDGMESDSSEIACFFVDLANDPPTAPTIIDPTDNATVSTLLPTIIVTDGVDPEARATIHEFEVDSVDSFDSESLQAGSVDTDDDGQTAWTTVSELTEDTVWYARARCNDGGTASDWVSVSFLVSVEDGAPTTPTLVSPEDGLELGEAPSFVVDNATDPEGESLSYDFQVLDRSGSVVASVSSQEEGADGQTSWAPDTLADGVYTWTSRASDATGQTGDWAAAWSFAVSDGVITGAGGGADSGGVDSGAFGTGLDALEIKGEGCNCSTGGSAGGTPGGTSLALFGGLLGLLGLRRRRS